MTTRAGKTSAGLLLFRRARADVEVLLAHPGGPFWAKKDLGAWSVPKGEVEEGEEPLDAARREWTEETRLPAPHDVVPLGEVRQPGGKIVKAWAFEGDADPASLRSGTFRVEWPPRSGRVAEFPEVDRFAFFDLAEARRRVHPAQAALLDALEERLAGRAP